MAGQYRYFAEESLYLAGFRYFDQGSGDSFAIGRAVFRNPRLQRWQDHDFRRRDSVEEERQGSGRNRRKRRLGRPGPRRRRGWGGSLFGRSGFRMKNLAFWISATALLSGVVASGAGDEGRMPDLNGSVAWLNSTPFSSKSLRGKVVLVNFWTYTCINSLRELPYIKAWAAKYKDA